MSSTSSSSSSPKRIKSSQQQSSSYFSTLDSKIVKWRVAKEKAAQEAEKRNQGLEKRFEALRKEEEKRMQNADVASKWRNNFSGFTGRAVLNNPAQIPAGKPLTLGVQPHGPVDASRMPTPSAQPQPGSVAKAASVLASMDNLPEVLDVKVFAKKAASLLRSADKYKARAANTALTRRMDRAYRNYQDTQLANQVGRNYYNQSWLSRLSGSVWPQLILSMTGMLRSDTDDKLSGARFNHMADPTQYPGRTMFVGKTTGYVNDSIPVTATNV